MQNSEALETKIKTVLSQSLPTLFIDIGYQFPHVTGNL